MITMQSVYKLTDPRTNEVRYVGVTHNIEQRYQYHIKDQAENEKTKWIQELKRESLLPEIEILETNLMPVQAIERERWWMQYYLEQGSRLTNKYIWQPSSMQVIPQVVSLEEETTYTLEELICNLPIRLIDLDTKSGIHEETIKKIRRGRAARISTIRKLLAALSDIYGKQFSIENVTGINIFYPPTKK